MQSYLKNFLKSTEKTWEVKTQVIFNIFLRLKKSICRICTNVNTEETVKRKLMSL